MFPFVCPDHMLAAVSRITGAEERVRAQQVTGANTASFKRLVMSLWSPSQSPLADTVFPGHLKARPHD